MFVNARARVYRIADEKLNQKGKASGSEKRDVKKENGTDHSNFKFESVTRFQVLCIFLLVLWFPA